MIELSKIAAISGQGGLFLITSPLKNGVLMESLDEKKTKVVAGSTSKVSILSEISIYTVTSEGSVSLESVLKSLYLKHGSTLPVSAKSDGADLKNLLSGVLKEVDLDRVYVSDIKKLVNWYGILSVYAQEILKPEVKEEAKEEVKAEAKPAKKEKAVKSDEAEAAETPEGEKPKAKKAPAKKTEPKAGK